MLNNVCQRHQTRKMNLACLLTLVKFYISNVWLFDRSLKKYKIIYERLTLQKLKICYLRSLSAGMVYMCKYKNFNIYSLILHFRSECKSLTCTNEIETKVRVHWKNSHYVVLFSKSTPMCMWIKELFSTLYHYYSWARHSVKGEDHWLKI